MHTRAAVEVHRRKPLSETRLRPVFVKGDYFYREGDEVRRCQNDSDIERLFSGFSTDHLHAYNYQVDERYNRLLNPNWCRFPRSFRFCHPKKAVQADPVARPRRKLQEILVDREFCAA